MNHNYTYRGQVLFPWERDEDSEPIDIGVFYSLDPYTPATYESPAEGGGCYFEDFQLQAAEVMETSQGRAIVAQFKDAVETNDALRSRLEDYCREDAASRCEQTDRDDD